MDWNSVTLLVLAVFGFLGLCVMLAVALLRQLPELFEAWHTARRSLRGPSEPPVSQRSARPRSDD
ncbi:hypothetical protein [Streptomyces sp. enrichment culture]|uniref:hypothetical protein n=1 Tax=Streptomyces sp. enrichment culture TaxID=1795815 RepID=UPI003F55E610